MLVKLGRFSGEDLDFSFWCRSLDAKLAVSRRMDLVSDMATDNKSSMRENILGVPFFLLVHFLN